MFFPQVLSFLVIGFTLSNSIMTCRVGIKSRLSKVPFCAQNFLRYLHTRIRAQCLKIEVLIKAPKNSKANKNFSQSISDSGIFMQYLHTLLVRKCLNALHCFTHSLGHALRWFFQIRLVNFDIVWAFCLNFWTLSPFSPRISVFLVHILSDKPKSRESLLDQDNNSSEI